MQNHATMYCKYYQLQVLYTSFFPILGQISLYCLHGGFHACNPVYPDWIQVNPPRDVS